MNTLANISKVDAGHIFYKFLAGKLKDGNGPVDLDLLHKQKMTLIHFARMAGEAICDAKKDGRKKSEVETEFRHLEGLVEFLDAFQDMLVDDMRVWEYPLEEPCSAADLTEESNLPSSHASQEEQNSPG